MSIIIPCYNYGRYLSAALDSLLAQSLRDWECILVNNGSTDSTIEVCESYCKKDSRFIYIESENRGPAHARNVGIRRSSGTYIQFLDSDDLLEANKLATQVSYIEKHGDVDLVYGEVRYFTDSDPSGRNLSLWKPHRDWMPKISGNGFHLIKALAKYNIMSIHAPLFRRSALRDCGLMDESMWGFEDWDFWFRMALHGKKFIFRTEAESLSLVRSHEVSLNKDRTGMRKYLLNVWLKAMKSGRLPLTLWPYVLFRFEEEFWNSLVSGSSIKGLAIDFPVKLISLLVLPLFLPMIVIVKVTRFIIKSLNSKGRVPVNG